MNNPSVDLAVNHVYHLVVRIILLPVKVVSENV